MIQFNFQMGWNHQPGLVVRVASDIPRWLVIIATLLTSSEMIIW